MTSAVQQHREAPCSPAAARPTGSSHSQLKELQWVSFKLEVIFIGSFSGFYQRDDRRRLQLRVRSRVASSKVYGFQLVSTRNMTPLCRLFLSAAVSIFSLATIASIPVCKILVNIQRVSTCTEMSRPCYNLPYFLHCRGH